MEQGAHTEDWTLLIKKQAPSGAPGSELVIWFEGADDLSMAFARWHMHGDDDEILDDLEGLLSDRVVVCEDLGLESWRNYLLDLSCDDAVLSCLSGDDAPPRIRLTSWSGSHDRELTLEDLAIE